MRTKMGRARAAREYLDDLGVSISHRSTEHRFVGDRVIELDIENLALNVEHLLAMAGHYRRSVPVVSVQVWVDTAAETVEADERRLLGEEIERLFGLQADIRHTVDIDPSKVDAFTADFNACLREAWADRGVPTDVPDNYFDRCAEAGMTPEQCAAYWADDIPLELIA